MRIVARIAAFCVGALALAAQAQNLSIATGGTGGVYYPYGGGLAELLTDELPDYEFTAEATSASVDNMYLIESGDDALAFVLSDTAYDACLKCYEECGVECAAQAACPEEYTCPE